MYSSQAEGSKDEFGIEEGDVVGSSQSDIRIHDVEYYSQS